MTDPERREQKKCRLVMICSPHLCEAGEDRIPRGIVELAHTLLHSEKKTPGSSKPPIGE